MKTLKKLPDILPATVLNKLPLAPAQDPSEIEDVAGMVGGWFNEWSTRLKPLHKRNREKSYKQKLIKGKKTNYNKK